MEHAELVFEMTSVERMSTQERLQLARRRRRSQLKSWAAREREWLKTKQQSNGYTPSIRFSDNVILLEAASRNDIDEVKKMLTKGVSPDSTNDDGLTALHQCCIDDNEEMMKLLLEFGANVNAEDSERWTPLHAAATCGHLHLVKQLISNGANLLAVNGDGNMPYDICEDDACLEEIEGAMAKKGVTQNIIDETRAMRETLMLEDLITEELDLEKPDAQGVTPLHIASANGYMSVVEYLLDQHVATDPKDADGWQPVHAAACWGHVEVLELLVQNGADLNAQTKHDETPAEICEDAELRERIIELRTEQESRKQAEQARRRVRRSQSNNSRAHSVRRTSVRERGLTAKRDAAQEARFRLHAVQIPLGNEQPTPLPLNNEEIADVDGFTQRREPEGEDSCIEKSAPVDLPTETSYTTESNGKINIHVSVTINAGTLAELKKQRSQNRTIAPDVTSVLSQATLSDMESPQPKRFFGDMSENVVDDSKSKFCCSIC